ncbi:MAG TPA: DUF4142 domain-containing protein [Gammaproteobacteria bacterium]|nr:DUF4142 domain-containing protein [Gammaproteobacteria bacterium]
MKVASKNCAWIAGLLFAGAAAAQGDAGAAKFLEEAIRGNLAEVRMGELAQQRGKSNEARDFGKQLVSDHKMALEKSATLAKELGVRVPTEPSAAASKAYEMLSKLSGEQFDREFAMHMVMDHRKDIAEYRAAATNGSAPDVASLAKETLPTLEKHLAAAQALEKDLQASR